LQQQTITIKWLQNRVKMDLHQQTLPKYNLVSKRKKIATTNDNNKMATKHGKNGSAPVDIYQNRHFQLGI
jgi:hypothetical protein